METLYAFLISAIHAPYAMHGILLTLIIPLKLGKEYFWGIRNEY